MARKQHARWFLREWRKHRLLTQDQLADRTGLSKPYISQLERGDRQYTQELLEQFADVLGTDAASLIMRDPTDPEGIWSVWDSLKPTQRPVAARILRSMSEDDVPVDAPPLAKDPARRPEPRPANVEPIRARRRK